MPSQLNVVLRPSPQTVPDRADGEVDRWMMNMHHNHPMHRRQLSEPAAATATATATATSNDGSVMFLPVSPDAVVAQLNTFFSQIAQANEEFARVARGVETVATAAAAEQGSAFPSEVLVRQPQVTSEAVVASRDSSDGALLATGAASPPRDRSV